MIRILTLKHWFLSSNKCLSYPSTFISIVVIFILLSGTSCKNNEKVPASEVTNNEIVLPQEIFQAFIVNVDDLRVRQSPGLEGSVIDKIEEGSLVISENEYTEKEETIVLRGKERTAPFYYVSGEGIESGWVYGGALTLVYQGDELPPFTSRISELNYKLNALNLELDEERKKLFTLLTEYKGSEPVWNDALYYLSLLYMDRMPSYLEIPENEVALLGERAYKDIFDNRFDHSMTPYSTNLIEQGYRLDAGEGLIYAVRDNLKVRKDLRGPFSEELTDFLAIQEYEQNNRIISDGGLVIELIALADHLINMERFRKKYPDFILKDKIDFSLNELTSLFIFGANNTPSKDVNSDELSEQFKNAFLYVIAQYPDSKLADTILKEYPSLYQNGQ